MCCLVYMSANPVPPRPQPADDLPEVGVRDLRHNLSSVLKRVAAGETIVVTDRGKRVGRMIPEPAQPISLVEQLIAEGKMTRGRTYRGGWPKVRPRPGQPTVFETLMQMREEDDR